MKPLLAAGALLLLSGCVWVIPVPHVVFTAPKISGLIVARDSGSRLEGARIFFVGRENADTISGADGAFVLDRQIDVPLVAIGGEDDVYHYPTPRKMPAAIRVVRSGYADRVIQLRPYYLEREKAWQASQWPREPKDKITLDLGTITLEPLAPPASAVEEPAH